MFPGMGGMNPKQMEKMMKQMGISQEEVSASRVVFELDDGRTWVINNPSVQKIEMMGRETYQVSGSVSVIEEQPVEFSQKDLYLVMEQTGACESDVRKALEETGDLAEAIMKLKAE